MGDFRDTKEFEFRRSVRQSIRASALSRAQKDVALAFFNHWLQHRKSKEGIVHPGRKKLAKKAKASISTASRTLEILRENGVLVARAHLQGLHGNATEYSVSIPHLYAFSDKKKEDILVNGGSKDPTQGRVKMNRRISNVISLEEVRKTLGGAA